MVRRDLRVHQALRGPRARLQAPLIALMPEMVKALEEIVAEWGPDGGRADDRPTAGVEWARTLVRLAREAFRREIARFQARGAFAEARVGRLGLPEIP